ncbi:hypothetical protein IQ230_03170 [Gloeocapsopsis crepidinum LEGE 06123]|uniref:Uncharacterized protein n=1 Tax=Gloeocapsopsis crepidinum LEGE 06123 TaxID=588587 RepID=A0ABR9UMX1_9CHRO|nr:MULTISPECIES: hypothetical protein [Gloeocapsopsis]MBE9189380.1 hypothetical protein [Gloeocapsopsis crepidinum LEGE 06123]PIG94421.1 hypothetical protein CSQ79_03775 [Gloeocapsopsis sp. IPPAS B-1203]
MDQEARIRELFGDKDLKYLKNKNRGGSNNTKGNTYENYFAVYRIALLSPEVLEEHKEIQISSQVLAFVDDLIIEYVNENIIWHYQLKNSSDITWDKGKKTNQSIADDFHKQYQLNKSQSKESELHLVVSYQYLLDKLKADIPTSLEQYSRVIYFPYEDSLEEVLKKEDSFRHAIEYLCAFDNPDPDKIECVASVLLGAWTSSTKSNSVKDILKKAQASTPSFIRSFSKEWQLDPEVENILSKIEDFQYNLTKGFLHWKYKDGLDLGTFPYSCDTEQFRKFQQCIKKRKPTCFDELEEFLPASI